MITLNFTNEEIALAICECFPQLSVRFQVQIADKYKENNDDDYIQTIHISKDDLVTVYQSCTVIPEGIISKQNAALKLKLAPILTDLAENKDKDAIFVLSKIADIDSQNVVNRSMKILLGKSYLSKM